MSEIIHAFGRNGELSSGAAAALEGLGGGGGGATALGDLTDVDTTGATTGQVLTFDGSEWSPDAPSAGTVTSSSISDSTATGRAVLTAADAATARSAIGAGTSNLTIGTTGSTAAAGNHNHDGVYVKPADLSTVATSGSYDDLDDKPTIPSGGVSADAGNLLTLGSDSLPMLDPNDLPAGGGGGGGATGPRTRSGYWRLPDVGFSTSSAIAARGNFIPLVLNAAQTWDALGITVSTEEEGATAHLALYSDDGTGYPGQLLVDAGIVDCSTTGAHTATFTPLALPAGLVWVCSYYSDTGTLRVPVSQNTFSQTSLQITGHAGPVGSNTTFYRAGYADNSLTAPPLSAPSGMPWNRWVALTSLRAA